MVRLWERSRAATTWLGLAGLLTFPVAGGLLGLLYLATHPTPGPGGFSGEAGVLLMVGILLGLCAVTAVVHELVHALAMAVVGHRPTLHFHTLPYLRMGLDGRATPFARPSFVWVELAPVVLVTAALITGVVTSPYSGWLIVPAAFHLTASKMDIAYTLAALREPAGTLCRVIDAGLEFTEPVDYLVP
jgi:hypothetical protein